MYFVIDIGNTHTVAGIYDSDHLVKQWRIKTDSAMTADELGISYHNLFMIANINTRQLKGVVFSSVVPRLDSAYISCCKNLIPNIKEKSIYHVTCESVADLIRIELKHPEEVGADRLVNSIAAFTLYKKPAIVIDFGTAITFDCISDTGSYIGGLILPGLKIALDALTTKAAKLPQIDISVPPKTVIGTDTVSAMKSGVMNGYGAMIDGLVSKVKNEMSYLYSNDIVVIATGGMAKLLQPFSPSIDFVEPELTLTGLALIYKKLSN